MAYPKREPSRRDRWKAKVGRTQTVPAAARLFLVTVLAPKMSADGKVSVPRKRLAAAAGVSERRVTMFITQAKEAGWLVVVQAGYRTMTAEYQATFPDYESGNTVFSHSRPESGNETDPHCAGTECSLITPGKREHSVPTTSSSTTRPLRVVTSARCGSGSLSSLRFGFGMNDLQRRTTKAHRQDRVPHIEGQHAARRPNGVGTLGDHAARRTTRFVVASSRDHRTTPSPCRAMTTRGTA